MIIIDICLTVILKDKKNSKRQKFILDYEQNKNIYFRKVFLNSEVFCFIKNFITAYKF